MIIIFNEKPHKNYEKWHKWFAWRPVFAWVAAAPDNRRAFCWLTFIERKKLFGTNKFYEWNWIYRLPHKKIP